MLDWGEVYTAYYQAVFRYVYGKLGHFDDAQDITADTFIKAIQAEDRGCGCTDTSLLAPWLCRIARNTLIDHLRFGDRRPNVGGDLPDYLVDTRPDLHEEAEAAILTDRLRSAMNFLPDGQQRVVIMWAEGYHLEEIAGALGTATGTVKSRLWRARAALRFYADVTQEEL